MGFQLVPKFMTLHSLEYHYDVILHLTTWMPQFLELTMSNWLQTDHKASGKKVAGAF